MGGRSMAGGILADWAPMSIKIEPPDGDPYRALNIQPGKRPEGMINHNFFVANRNKRSISIDLKTSTDAGLPISSYPTRCFPDQRAAPGPGTSESAL